jgi:hypothetical protein
MAKVRRSKVTAASEAVRVMQASLRGDLQPPAHVPLTDDELPFWRSLLGEMAKAEWSAHQLELAALTARDMAFLSSELRRLQEEGSVLFTGKGSAYANPRVSVVHGAQARILAARRSLSIHGRAQGGEARDVATRRQHMRAIEDDNPLADELLARPN